MCYCGCKYENRSGGCKVGGRNCPAEKDYPLCMEPLSRRCEFRTSNDECMNEEYCELKGE